VENIDSCHVGFKLVTPTLVIIHCRMQLLLEFTVDGDDRGS
jgi:hypothetical protein